MAEWSPAGRFRDALAWRRDFKAACAVFAVAVIASLVLQNDRNGFGHLPHHDWVSSHNLAIAENSTPESLWVGYTSCHVDRKGSRNFYYFTRFPVLPSLLMKAVMRPFSRASTKIWVARHLTDLFFLAAIFICALILMRLGHGPLIAMGAALLAFSSPIHQMYRDMTAIDLYGLVGFAAVIYAIVRFQQGGAAPKLFAAVLGAELLGIYAIGVLLCWWFLEFSRLAWLHWRLDRGRLLRPGSLGRFAGSAAKMPATRVLLFGALALALILAYNVVGEQRFLSQQAALGMTSWSGLSDRASILESARFRLGLVSATDSDFGTLWGNFLTGQARVFATASIPWLWHGQLLSWLYHPRPALVYTLLVLAAALWSIRRAGPARTGYLILLLAGAFWCFPMRRLSQYHNYQGLFYFGPLLVLAALLMQRLPARAARVAVGLCVLVFIDATVVSNRLKGREAPQVNAVTRDFEHIAPLVGKGANLFAVGGRDHIVIRSNTPYAVDFYLPGRCFAATEAQVDFVLSRSRRHRGLANLTPSNHRVFLFGRFRKSVR